MPIAISKEFKTVWILNGPKLGKMLSIIQKTSNISFDIPYVGNLVEICKTIKFLILI